MKYQTAWAIIAVLPLAACNSEPGDRGSQPTATAPTRDSAEASGPAESNSASLAYPGSQITGHRFSTSDPVDRVVAWYWDEQQPMRERGGQTWAVSKPERRDGGYLVQLTVIGDSGGQSFAVYLTPNAGGGTDGRIRSISDEEIRSGVKL